MKLRLALGTALTLFGVCVSSAQAETLRGALASAYKFNPDVEAERANLRATNEGVPQAKSGYRPTVSAGR